MIVCVSVCVQLLAFDVKRVTVFVEQTVPCMQEGGAPDPVTPVLGISPEYTKV